MKSLVILLMFTAMLSAEDPAENSAENKTTAIDQLIATLSYTTKFSVQAEDDSSGNTYWVLADNTEQVLAKLTEHGAVVIAKETGLTNKLQTLVPESTAENLVNQLVVKEIAKNGGVDKVIETTKQIEALNGPQAFSAISPLVRAAYLSHGITIPNMN